MVGSLHDLKHLVDWSIGDDWFIQQPMIWTEWENGHTHVAHFFNDHSVSNREEKTISFISILSIVYKQVNGRLLKD